MKTLTDFKKTLEPGMHVERVFLRDGQIASIQQRVVSSVTSGGFVTRDHDLKSPAEMRFGKASEWEFDSYIAGWGALWTDPEDRSYQVQYVFVERGF